MKKFLDLLANSPFGTALKIGAGAGLVWLLNNISSLNLTPAQSVAGIALLTIAINALNPQDTRYGNGADSGN